jgi:hypothetical protein
MVEGDQAEADRETARAELDTPVFLAGPWQLGAQTGGGGQAPNASDSGGGTPPSVLSRAPKLGQTTRRISVSTSKAGPPSNRPMPPSTPGDSSVGIGGSGSMTQDNRTDKIEP